MSGGDLIEFVNTAFMLYLRNFKQIAQSGNMIEYKINDISTDVRGKFKNGSMLRDALAKIDESKLGIQQQKHRCYNTISASGWPASSAFI